LQKAEEILEECVVDGKKDFKIGEHNNDTVAASC